MSTQKPQKREEEKKLRETIKDVQKVAKDSSILTDMPTKGLGIILGDVPEELSKIIDHQPENKVEMKYFGKTLERLWYYLNFYRESNELVKRLRKTAKSLMKQENHKVKVTAFRITTEEDNSKILNDFSKREDIFYTTETLEIFDLEHLLFIESSRNLLEYGNIKLFKTAPGLRFINKLLTLKIWILSNFNKEDFNKFLVIGSTVIFSFGIRIPNDIDLYVENSLKKQGNKPTFDQAFIRRFQRKKRNSPEDFFKSINVILEGFGRMKEDCNFSYYHTRLPKVYGAKDIKEVIDNTKFHYFFLGLKCISFQGMIERKLRQTRNTAYADLLYMQTQKRLQKNKNWNIHLSCLRPEIFNYEKRVWEPLPKDKHLEIYKNIHKCLRNRYNYHMSIEEIKKKISKSPMIEPIKKDT